MIIFKNKTEYDLEILTHETMKLLRSTKSRRTKNDNGKNAPHIEITKVTLVYCNMVNNDYQDNLKVLYKFVSNKSFG